MFSPCASHRSEQLAYTMVCFGTLLALYSFQSYFFAVRPDTFGWLGRAGIVPTAYLLVAVLLDAIAACVLRTRRAATGAVIRAGIALLVLALPMVLFQASGSFEWLKIHPLLNGLPEGERLVQSLLDSERVLNLDSNLSPLLPATLVAFIGYLWGRCQLRRLWLIENTAVPNPLSVAHGLAGAGFPNLEVAIKTVIARPFTSFPAWLAALIWLAPCVALYRLFLPTFEGWVFDRVFEVGFFLSSIGIVLAAAHAGGLWLQVASLLDRLSVHPIGASLGALPERVSRRVRDSMYAYIPSVGDQELVVRWLQQLARQFTALPEASRKKVLRPATIEDLTAALAHDVGPAEAALMEALSGGRPGATLTQSLAVQRHIDGVAPPLVIALEDGWERGVLAPHAEKDEMASGEQKDAGKKDAEKRDGDTDPAVAWLLDVQAFIATQVVTHLGAVFAHIRNLLTFVMAGLLLLMLTVPSYPFLPQRLLSMFAWALVLLVVSGALIVAAQMNRSEVVSRITRTTPNQFDRTFIRELVVYGGVPLLSLIATQFPGVGSALFFWVEPALRALK